MDQAVLAHILAQVDFDEAASAIPPGATPSAAVVALAEAGLMTEALRLAAHCLPKREAVWWGCMCAARTAKDEDSRGLLATEAAQAWVRRPSEASARSAWAAAAACRFSGAEAWTAVAAFWSGPSLNDAGLPPVPPPAHLTGVAVNVVLQLAMARRPGAERPVLMRQFLGSSHDIALGGVGRIDASHQADDARPARAPSTRSPSDRQ